MSFGVRQSPRTSREYIRNLVAQGHESVFEHAAWTFLLSGVSRSFTHQLVRHRIGFSYSQLSQQYHDEREAETVVPSIIRGDPELLKLWDDVTKESTEAYERLVEGLQERAELQHSYDRRERLRFIRSAARGILPGNTETKVVVTANARALRHFLALRGAIIGDEEMRRVSVALLRILQVDAPSLFEDFEIAAAPDGGALVRLTSPTPGDAPN
jgi:thymidylate synthase (FAD)